MPSWPRVNLKYLTGYPGNGMYYIYCDVCGAKIRAKNAVYIRDKYSTQTNLLVCKRDVDITNPQTLTEVRRERQIDNPRLIRSEPADRIVYIDDPSQIEGGDTSDPTGRTPGEPRYLAITDTSTTTISLCWTGPIDPGTPYITGWKIERESPVGGGFSTTTADTGSEALAYKDTGLTTGTTYNYRVSAINAAGTSDPSNETSGSTD